jgi:DNA modification methylase
MKNIDFMKNGIPTEVLDELYRVMKKVNIYIWASQKQIPIFYKYFVESKKCNWNLISWHKTNPTPTCGNKYLNDTEYILFFRDKGVKIYGTYATKRTFYVSKKNLQDKKLYGHPTIKPLDIIENLIINSSKENDTVLDCFMGSGTTGVACKKLNRNFIGYEIDEKYFNIAKERIENTEV